MMALANGTFTTQINGVGVVIRYGWYSGLVEPANFQWCADVPLFDNEGEFEKRERVRRTLPVIKGRRYEYLKELSTKELQTFVVSEIAERHVKVQDYHSKVAERELAEIEEELSQLPEKQARRDELEAIIAKKEK